MLALGAAVMATPVRADKPETPKAIAGAQVIVSRVVDGDFRPVEAAPGAGGIIGELAIMVQRLSESISAVRDSAEQIRLASSEVAASSSDLSHRTEVTAGSQQSSSSAIVQMVGSARQTADHARTANQLASTASEFAARGGTLVSEVVDTMERIHGSSRKISHIIGTIDGIAFQTDILALNAAVEAARAGEQGRGFAVVASEVRGLAQRNAHAAREIKQLIEASVESVESGTRLVASTGETMRDIVQGASRVSGVVGAISAAAQQQSEGIELVSGSVTQLERATQQNATLVEQSTAAASSLLEQAQRLADAVARFRIEAATQPG